MVHIVKFADTLIQRATRPVTRKFPKISRFNTGNEVHEAVSVNKATTTSVWQGNSNRINTPSRIDTLTKSNQFVSPTRRFPKVARTHVKKSLKPYEYDAYAKNFEQKKQNLIKELSEFCDANTITRMEKADTPEKMVKIVNEIEKSIFQHIRKSITPENYLKYDTFAQEQLFYNANMIKSKFILKREKALFEPSTNEKVITIENLLKDKYGMEFVSLKDNEELAVNLLKACELATKNEIRLPKNFVASHLFVNNSGQHLYNNTIIFPTTYVKFRPGYTSTNSEYHIPLHEILHGEHPHLRAYYNKTIPAKYKSVIDNLSVYAKKSNALGKSNPAEIFTELNTKRLIKGLNPEEQELFDYLNVFVKSV